MNIAEFSPCRNYRYTLWRHNGIGMHNVEKSRYVNFIMLNPSTADEVKNDPTVARCVRYALDWGYEAMCVTNIFAFRATDPKVMKAQDDPIGPDNDRWLAQIAKDAHLVVAAWGTHGQFKSRSTDVLKLLPQRPQVLRLGAKEPWHPLYLPASLKPVEWAATTQEEAEHSSISVSVEDCVGSKDAPGSNG